VTYRGSRSFRLKTGHPTDTKTSFRRMTTRDISDANAQVAASLILQKLQFPQGVQMAKQPELQQLAGDRMAKQPKPQGAAATQRACISRPHPPIEVLSLWESIVQRLLHQPEAQLPVVQEIIRSMRKLRERHAARLRPYQSLCTCCGVLNLRGDLEENRCEACDTTVPPEGFMRICNTGVPISAFRQMGLKGWWCSADDASFAKTLRRISCQSDAYCDELADDVQSCSRAEAINNRAFGLMREDREYEDEEIELELEMEEDSDKLDDLLWKLWSLCGFLASAAQRQGVALRKQISEERELMFPDVWISDDLYNRVAEQAWAAQIVRDFHGYD